MTTNLGDKIRALRKEKQMTLDTLAALAGMSKSYLWELENRPAPRPSAEKLNALAEHLGRPVAYFLEEDEATPEEVHMDEAFFRNFKNLEAPEKDMLRTIVESFRKKQDG
jgi:transcriptional regulator with XRE-family HTH domain